MQIKRFEAKDMTTALGLIKDELGSDAVILSARSLRKGKGFFGSMKYAGVEVTAAIDNLRLPMKNSIYSDQESRYLDRDKSQLKGRRVGKSESIQTKSYPTQIQIDRRRNPSISRSNSRKNHKALSSLYQQILAQDVDRSIVADLIEEINRLPVLLKNMSADDLRYHFSHVLEEMGVVIDRAGISSENPSIAALIGITGVGKTTTIAKIAALQSRRYKKRVALITLDNYGITAIEQLKTYADIIGIPLAIATNYVELKHSIKEYKDQDLILIDTPGLNPHDKSLIQDLKRYFSKIAGLQTHLVLSATTKEKDLVALTKAFKNMNVDRLLFTKIDESSTYGNIVNLLIRTNIPLSFLCCGRKVPDDIEPGSMVKLIDLLLQYRAVNNRQTSLSSDMSDSQLANRDMSPTIAAYFVANQNSDVYHCPDCKWTKKIKSANIIKFSTTQEAESQNFLPCSNCKPDQLQYCNNLDSKAEKMKLSSSR